jgi:MutS domain V
MKAFLMHRDRDFDLQQPLPPQAADLTQDMELEVVFKAMAAGDEFLLEVAKKVVLTGLTKPEDIVYRQQILIDCMAKSGVVRGIYNIAIDAIEREKRIWGWMTSKYAAEMLHRAAEVLELFAGVLKQLRSIADEHGAEFHSEGFQRFFAMLSAELDDDYLGKVADHLERLAFRGGVLMSAELGPGNKGNHYILRKPPDARRGWMERLQDWVAHLTRKSDGTYFYEVAERDEAGFNALSELKAEGIGSVAVALAQSTDHILSFFKMLRLELGFYVCCLNLHDRLAGKSEPICIPQPVSIGEPVFSCQGMYDPCLSLSMESRVVGNDVAGDGKTLVVITGANRGGKSTLLRGRGLAQLMMQCGMFVAAESFRANVCNGVFTHFKREEDADMKSGKLDEELSRMSAIVDRIAQGCILLLNESFASTNEREGSEIARQIVRALLETGVKVFYVTHMYDLARGFYAEHLPSALFLRAERLGDGARTYRLVEGEPLPTSYGEDLYRAVFGKTLEIGDEPPLKSAEKTLDVV